MEQTGQARGQARRRSAFGRKNVRNGVCGFFCLEHRSICSRCRVHLLQSKNLSVQIHCGAQRGNCMGGELRSDATRVEHVRPLANALRRFFGAGQLSKPGLDSETDAVFGGLRNGCFAAARSSEVFVTGLSGDGNGKMSSSTGRPTSQFPVQRCVHRSMPASWSARSERNSDTGATPDIHRKSRARVAATYRR